MAPPGSHSARLSSVTPSTKERPPHTTASDRKRKESPDTDDEHAEDMIGNGSITDKSQPSDGNQAIDADQASDAEDVDASHQSKKSRRGSHTSHSRHRANPKRPAGAISGVPTDDDSPDGHEPFRTPQDRKSDAQTRNQYTNARGKSKLDGIPESTDEYEDGPTSTQEASSAGKERIFDADAHTITVTTTNTNRSTKDAAATAEIATSRKDESRRGRTRSQANVQRNDESSEAQKPIEDKGKARATEQQGSSSARATAVKEAEPEGRYKVGVHLGPEFAGKDLTTLTTFDPDFKYQTAIPRADLKVIRDQIKAGLYHVAPVKDERYMYRLLESEEDLEAWLADQKGTRSKYARPLKDYPRKDVDIADLLADLADLVHLRKSIIGNCNLINDVDRAEKDFMHRLFGAKQKYARDLQALRVLPIPWQGE